MPLAISRCDLDQLRRSKVGLTENQLQVRSLLNPPLTAAAEAFDDVAFTFPDPWQIDTDWAGTHSIIGTPASKVGDASTCHHSLGGSATLIHTGASHVFPLNQRSAHPGLRKRD